MTILHALILGIVEGVTEFLPVSSTGHLIIAGSLLGIPASDFTKTFEIAIQLGAIMSVLVLYGKKVLVERQVILRVIAAFIPTALVGFVLYKLIKDVLLSSTSTVLWSLFIGGIVLIIFEQYHRESPHTVRDMRAITYRQAVIIGFAQSLAVVPGVSRAAATIVGGMWLGVQRKTIVEFSFLLAVPTMLAATGYDLMKNAPAFTAEETGALVVGALTSFLVAIVVIKSFVAYIQKSTFTAFGIYRIIAAGVFWLLLR